MRLSDSIIYRERVSLAFAERLVAMCARLGVNPDHLMAAMAFETGGSFDPSITNGDRVVWTGGAPGGEPGGAEDSPSYRLERHSGSSGTGLIQFMAATARGLGTTPEALRAMTAPEQLRWVERYFRPYAGRLHSLEDVYMAILYPRAIGRAPGYVLFRGGGAYRANAGLDANEDGRVTKREAAARVRRLYERGLQAREQAPSMQRLPLRELPLRELPLRALEGAAPRPLPTTRPTPSAVARRAAPPHVFLTLDSSHSTAPSTMTSPQHDDALSDASTGDVLANTIDDGDPNPGVKETLEIADFFESLLVGLVERVRDGIGPADAVALVLDEDIRSDALAAVAGMGEVAGELVGILPAEMNAVAGRFEQAGFAIARAFIADVDGEDTDAEEAAGIEEILDVIDFGEIFVCFAVVRLKDGVQLADAVALARDAALQEAAFEAFEGAARLPVEVADLSLREIEQITSRLRAMAFDFYQTVLAG